MIKISLDEAYVFDMLSVLDIKLSKLNDQKFQLTKSKFDNLKNEIIEHISLEKFTQIYDSEEYKNLVNANLRIFELIDLSKSDNGLAKITDDANFKRHIEKSKLQNKFFNNDLTEVKNRDL